jgi:hypothetical protein
VTGPRVPLVAGAEPGAGTSTLAAALHAEDGGLLGQHADVVVCRPAPGSLRAAAAIACPGRGPHPVLAVTGPLPGPLPTAVRTRFGAVVELPLVERWAGTPASGAAGALTDPSPALLPYAEALREIVAALIGSGQLDAAAPPMAIRPRTTDPWRDTSPFPPPSRRREPTAEPARSPAPAPPDPVAEPDRRPDATRSRAARPLRPAGPDEDDETIELRNQLAGWAG